MNQENQVNPLLVKPKQAALVLAISERTLWQLTQDGEIPAIKLGGSVRYSVDDLKRSIEAHKQTHCA